VSAHARGTRSRPALAVLGVAAIGTLAGHELGYLLGGVVDATLETSHAHLSAFLGVAPLAAAWALLAAALTDPRRGWTRQLTARRLASSQAVLYGALEVGERALVGAPMAELGSASVVLGLLAQGWLAAAAVLLVRLAQSVVGHVLRGCSPPLVLQLPAVPVAVPVSVPASRRPLTTSSRGPPHRSRSRDA
jgi:hypothetical protein